MRLSNHRRCRLSGHVDRDAAGSPAIPRSFGAARRRRYRSGFPAREWFPWQGAGALWRAVCLPYPQSCSHRRDREVRVRTGAWGCLPRRIVCPKSRHRARTLGAVALTCRGHRGLGAPRSMVRRPSGAEADAERSTFQREHGFVDRMVNCDRHSERTNRRILLPDEDK